ncbi:MAG: PAS domain S-box protein [Candidatus Binataceae bacterium]|nr:PAS domain S-box protein [Candidatus Binataceae bacterium]
MAKEASAEESAADDSTPDDSTPDDSMIDRSDDFRQMRVLRASAVIVLAFQVLYLAADWKWSNAPSAAYLPPHLFSILTAAIFLRLTYLPVFRRRMELFILAGCALLFAATTVASVVTANSAPLTLTVILTLVGAAALVPWDWRWQAVLATAGVVAMAAMTAIRPGLDAHLGNDWLAIAAAAAVAHYAALQGQLYRREIAQRIMAFEIAHRHLLAEIAQRESVVAASEQVHRQLAESEAKLRKIFETSSDAITINRMSDGRYLEVNEAFSVFGYTREQALSGSSGALGIWTDQAALRRLLKALKTTGGVVNQEVILRARDGGILPFLISAKVIDLGGEQCVVTIGRDIRSIKQTEADLIGVREELREQIAALRLSDTQLRAEIAQRERVMADYVDALRRLGESEAKLRKVFEASLDTIAIASLVDGRCIEVNQSFLEMSGLTLAEVIGRPGRELGIWADLAQLAEYVRRLRRHGFVRNMEVTLRHRDGRLMPYLASAVVTEIGGEPCIVTIARDNGERKTAEIALIAAREELSLQVRALRDSQRRLRAEVSERERVMAERARAQRKLTESETRLRKIFDSSFDTITVHRMSEGNFIDANTEFTRAFGYTRDEVLGQTPAAIGSWLETGDFRQFIAEVQQVQTIRNREVKLRAKNGRIMLAQISATMVEIDGEPCMVVHTRDITESKRVERELIAARESALAASQAKSEFLSSMSHEIRTPMNAVLGMADLLWESPLDSEQRRYLETMRNNGNALLDLINGILDLAKVESGRISLERTPFAIVETVEKVLETLAIRAHEKRLELSGRIAPGVAPGVIGDPLRLRQILINLIGNAIKFTTRGAITVTVETVAPPADALRLDSANYNDALARTDGAPANDDAAWIRFAVTDTGIGIAADQLASIFSSFTQADSSTARRYGGSGLGLSIAKRLVELMRGKLTVISEAGRGSTFSFTIPLTPGDPGDAPSVPRLEGVRVLIADGRAARAAATIEMLTAAGATAVAVADPTAALAAADRARADGFPYDVIIVDHHPPLFDGIEAAQQLLHWRAALDLHDPHGAIILMLATDTLQLTRAHLELVGLDPARGCRYLVKPAKRSELLHMIAELTDRSAAANAAFRPAAQTAAMIAAAATMRGAGSAAAIDRDERPLHILLADDSPDNRLLIDAYLKNMPYRIDHAENGAIAIEMAGRNAYDLVLMDIQMPVVDGYTATTTIRNCEAAEGRRRVPIIALTASALDDAVRRSVAAGCDAHVSKPVKKATLLEAIYNATATAGRLATNGASPDAAASGGEFMTAGAIVKRPSVQVDADLSDLIPGFLEHKRADVVTLRAALDRGDYTALAALAHKIKGEGGSYGFDAVTELGAALEPAIAARQPDAVRVVIEQLAGYLEAVEVIYEPD